MANDTSERIKEAIQKSGLTLIELQDRTGIPKSAIQRYATGSTEKLPIDRVKAIAKATGFSPAYLMGWEESKNTKKRKIIIDKMIEKHMRLKSWTMKELGEKVGKGESTVSMWIAGKAQPKMGTVQKLADLFEITTDELVYGSDDDIDPTLAPSNITSLEEAVQITLNNPSVAFYGGYDVDKLSDQEKIDFANWIADSIKFYAQRFGK